MWFFKQKPPIPKPIDPEVSKYKRRTQKAAQDATESSERLNEIFIENGITLTIIRAASGRKHGH